MASMSNKAVNESGLSHAGIEASASSLPMPCSQPAGKMRGLLFAIFGAAQAVCVLAAPSAFAEETSPCQQFAWSIARESNAFSAPELRTVRSGTAEQAFAERGIALKLEPISNVSFPLPAERKPKHGGGFGGVLKLAGPPQAGLYQITISDEAWIDVIQDGRFLTSKAHSGKKGCPGVRKSVRFDLQAAPVILQLSDASTDTIKVAILPTE